VSLCKTVASDIHSSPVSARDQSGIGPNDGDPWR
jgi:hypothetical protein